MTNDSPRVLVLSLSHSDESMSRRLAVALRNDLDLAGARVEMFDSRDLPPIWVDGAKLDGAPEPYLRLERLIADVDGIVVAHPVYAYAASSATKVILELYGPVLSGKAVGFASAAGTLRSHLAVASSLVSAMFDASAFCHPRTLQVTGEDHAGTGFNADVQARIADFATAFTAFTRAISTLRPPPAAEEEPAYADALADS